MQSPVSLLMKVHDTFSDYVQYPAELMKPIHSCEGAAYWAVQVWVGIEYPSAAKVEPSTQSSNLQVRQQQHRKTARQKGLDSQPSLPSLVVADVAVLPG